ncbi:MAG: Crp/Fnr family transcriptional regulator [Clostridia bacterium]|nr:Crp/Fnr family transcriptional regulator [Clostridia bacterium]
MNKKDLKTLCECALFQNSGYAEQKEVFSFSAGEIISTPNGQKQLGIVLSGRAKAVEEDNETLLNLFEKGDIFKAAGLFAESQTCTNVIAETAVRAVFYSEEQILSLVAQYPKISENYIRFLADRIAFLNRKISFFSLPSTEMRLARYLYCQAGSEIKISSAKLCLVLSVARASLYRAFKSLQQQGAITHQKGKITINDKNILKRIYKGE